ncbi:hypothetical protein [uncultured Muriicola sp.]|uniref:hypothetical protein n=1 Tax=uncultured Muriicola sp. TaxID=1583102 RepID=UPI00260F5F3B|nr:hypothetical protein [uncultured Muriicola sp.]
MAIKRNSIFFISVCIYSLLSVFWPELEFFWSGYSGDSGLNIAMACILHAILYHLLAYSFSNYCGNPSFLKTPFAISCLVSIAYLGVPFLKYYGEARYIEFDVGLHYRLFALLVVCASILMILNIYAKRWTVFYLESQKAMHQSVGPLFVPFMYCIFGASLFYLIVGSIERDLSEAQITLIKAGYFVSLFYFAVLGDQHKTLWNGVLLVIGGLAITYFSGARSALLLAVLVVVFGRISRIRSHQNRKSMVLLGLVLIPLVTVMSLGPLTALTKDRYGGISLNFELQRTDYVDFVGAASIADYKENVTKGLYTSSLWAIPGGYIDKAGLDYSMEPFFYNNKWRSSDRREGYTPDTNDYPDSIFSCGAMVGGYVGALLFPLVWFGVFSIVLRQLNNTLLLSFYLGSIPSMFNIEIAFWNIVPTLRNWFVASIMLFVVIQLASILRPKFEANRKRRK